MFYGTSIPTCILVVKKSRTADEGVLFIDASGDDHFIREKTQNVLRDTDVENILQTCHNHDVKEKYSYLASLNEIAKNDYNLDIPRYVDTFEEEEPINLEQVSIKLVEIN